MGIVSNIFGISVDDNGSFKENVFLFFIKCIFLMVFISTIIGGRDTAGLGGKGGPYRLDAGHRVYQVSQAEKDAVPEEVKRAAREMGEKAFKQR